MSVQTEVLYGNRLYSEETYSSNEDPETLSLSLSDSTTLSENRVDSISQVLADLMSLADARVMTSTKPLADSSTLTDSVAKILSRALADSTTLSDARIISATKVLPPEPTITGTFPLYGPSLYTEPFYGLTATGIYDGTILILDSVISFLSTKILAETATMTEIRLFMVARTLVDALIVADQPLVIHQTKGLSDFVKLHDWISIKLSRANIWVTHEAVDNTPAVVVLYDQFLYDDPLYSTSRRIEWVTTLEDSASWTTPSTAETPSHLYSKPLYSRVLYGALPFEEWQTPTTSDSDFTNFDGEGNVP